MIKQERLVFFFFLFLFASARNSIFKVSRFLLCVTFFVVNLHLLSFLNSLFFWDRITPLPYCAYGMTFVKR